MKNWYKIFAIVLLALCSCSKEPGGNGYTEDSDVVKNPNVFGKVCDTDGKGLAGVVVSDGFSSVKTDAGGEYAIESDLEKAKFIFVSQPAGYRAGVEKGLSTFYKTLGKTGATQTGGKYTVNFTLEKIQSNADRYTVLISADPQSRAKDANYDRFAYQSLDCQDDMFRDMEDCVSRISGSNICGIVLGDIVHERMDFFPKFTAKLENFDFPTYAVIGNHDNNPKSADDDKAAADFEKYFGPRNYSFNLGKVHVVVLDNLIMGRDGDPTKYTEGLTDDIWKWLQSDLKHVDKSSTVMVCSHSPMFRLASGNERYSKALHGYEYANLFNSFKKVYAWAGHVHQMFNYIPDSSSQTSNVETHTLSRATGDLWTNEWVCSDGTPRGYVVVTIDGEDVSWQFRPIQYQTHSYYKKTNKTEKLPAYERYTKQNGVTSYDVLYANGKKIGTSSYQMRAYPRGEYGDNYVYVNVFMWDSKWGTPQFTDKNGTKPMNLVSSKYDLEAFDIYSYYSKNNTTLKAEAGKGGYSCNKDICHLFRCFSGEASGSGTIKVKDRFGNEYTTTVSW